MLICRSSDAGSSSAGTRDLGIYAAAIGIIAGGGGARRSFVDQYPDWIGERFYGHSCAGLSGIIRHHDDRHPGVHSESNGGVGTGKCCCDDHHQGDEHEYAIYHHRHGYRADDNIHGSGAGFYGAGRGSAVHDYDSELRLTEQRASGQRRGGRGQHKCGQWV